jgi:hypothetical protein
VPSQHGIQYSYKTDGGGEVRPTAKGTDHNGHNSRAQDVRLLRVCWEDGGMIGQYRLYQFEAKGLRQAGKAQILGALRLCQET